MFFSLSSSTLLRKTKQKTELILSHLVEIFKLLEHEIIIIRENQLASESYTKPVRQNLNQQNRRIKFPKNSIYWLILEFFSPIQFRFTTQLRLDMTNKNRINWKSVGDKLVFVSLALEQMSHESGNANWFIFWRDGVKTRVNFAGCETDIVSIKCLVFIWNGSGIDLLGVTSSADGSQTIARGVMCDRKSHK